MATEPSYLNQLTESMRFGADLPQEELDKARGHVTTLTLAKGEFFLQRTESLLYLQALEDTTLLVIDHATYTELLARHVGWQVTARKLAELLFIIKEKREAELLLLSAPERYARFRRDFPGLEQRVNQYHIASYLGITPESLSRICAGLSHGAASHGG